MTRESKINKFQTYFYATPAGNHPVLDFLQAQSKEDRQILGKDLAKVEAGGPAIGKPTVDGLGHGLYEIRSTIAAGAIEVRILFAVEGPYLIMLHAFKKTTQKTPKRDIDTARTRWADARRSNQP